MLRTARIVGGDRQTTCPVEVNRVRIFLPSVRAGQVLPALLI